MVKKISRSFKYVYLALMILFLYIPILYLIVFSFNDFSTGRRISYANLGAWKGFTLHNYTTLFTGEAGQALLLTLRWRASPASLPPLSAPRRPSASTA